MNHMKNETIRINVHVGVDLNGGEWDDILEVDKAEWDSMSEDEREQMIKEFAQDISGYYWSYEMEE